MKPFYNHNARATLRQLREAYAALPYKPPDPNDPVAVRWDRATRIYNFIQAQMKEGLVEPSGYLDTPADIYQWILDKEAEEERQANEEEQD
jgi:hypothetical protein